MEFEEIGLEAWDATPSSECEAFHDPDALAVLDEHADGDLRVFAGHKGGQQIAVMPVFVSGRSVGQAVLSPPVSFSVPRLGPIVSPLSPKRRKYEKINRSFTEYLVRELGLDRRTTLFRMSATFDYDPRPFDWNGFDLQPRFTYVVDLADTDVESVMGRCSKSLRREMRSLEDTDLSIETEGVEAAERIYDDVVERYRERDETAPLTRAFLGDLLEALDDERWRAYVARSPDGEYQGGILVLYSDSLAYYWQGGVAASYDGDSVNALLHRAIIEDALTDPVLDSVTGYDLVGANTERLCDYKAKFGGELRSYYVVESSGLEMDLAKSAYTRFNRAISK